MSPLYRRGFALFFVTRHNSFFAPSPACFAPDNDQPRAISTRFTGAGEIEFAHRPPTFCRRLGLTFPRGSPGLDDLCCFSRTGHALKKRQTVLGLEQLSGKRTHTHTVWPFLESGSEGRLRTMIKLPLVGIWIGCFGGLNPWFLKTATCEIPSTQNTTSREQLVAIFPPLNS